MPDFDSGNRRIRGDTFEQTFDEPGKVDYVCTIHPGQSRNDHRQIARRS